MAWFGNEVLIKVEVSRYSAQPSTTRSGEKLN
jgi:hypothetical protein